MYNQKEQMENLQYQLNIKSNTMKYVDEVKTLEECLALFKKIKKSIQYRYTVDHYAVTNNIIMCLLLGQSPIWKFVTIEDYSLFIGYDEMRVLHKWITKELPIQYNGNIIYFNDLPVRLQTKILHTPFALRTYNINTNVHDIINLYYEHNITLCRKDLFYPSK